VKKRLIILVIVIIAIVIAVSLLVARRKNSEISGSGMIEVQEVEISAKISGQIKEIRSDEGSLVKPGDTLIILEHRELLAQQEAALAGYQVAEKTLNEIALNKKDIENNVKRIRNLYATNGVSENEKEKAETQLAVINSQVDKAKANLQAAKAGLNLIQTQIDNAYILSPIAGVILAKNFQVAEIILPGARLLKIGDLNTAWLKIYLSEREIGKIAIGANANVYVDAYPKQVFAGKITWITSEAEFTPKNIQTKEERTGLVYAVKITIPNPDQKLLPGMPADAKIIKVGHQ